MPNKICMIWIMQILWGILILHVHVVCVCVCVCVFVLFIRIWTASAASGPSQTCWKSSRTEPARKATIMPWLMACYMSWLMACYMA